MGQQMELGMQTAHSKMPTMGLDCGGIFTWGFGQSLRQRRTGPPKTGHFSRCASRKNNRARHHILVTPTSIEVVCSKWRLIIMATFLTIFLSHFFPPSNVFPSPKFDGFCLHIFVEILTFPNPFFLSPLGGLFHPYFVVFLFTISCPNPSFHCHFLHPTIVTNFFNIL